MNTPFIDHYELNIACGGRFYSRVRFPAGMTKAEALSRASVFRTALRTAFPDGEDWSFSLYAIHAASSHEVAID